MSVLLTPFRPNYSIIYCTGSCFFQEFWVVLELNYHHSNTLYLLLLKENLVQKASHHLEWGTDILEQNQTGRLEMFSLHASLFFFKYLLWRKQLLQAWLAGRCLLINSSFIQFSPAVRQAQQTQPEARWRSDLFLILLLLYSSLP